MKLNGKDWGAGAIHIGINKGWDEDDFISNYGLADGEELRKRLGEVYKFEKKRVNFILADMKRNHKRKLKSLRNEDALAKGAQEVPESETKAFQKEEPSVVQIEQLEDKAFESENGEVPTEKPANEIAEKAPTDENAEMHQNGDNTEGVIKPEVSSSTIQVELDRANDKAEKLRAIQEKLKSSRLCIAKLEKSRKEIYEENRNASKSLTAISKKISQLEQEVLNLKAQAIVNSEIILDSPKKLEENSNRMANERAKIASLEDQLKKLNTKTIYCSEKVLESNKQFEFDYHLSRDIEIDSDSIKDKVRELMENDDIDIIEEFSIKQVKTIAKIILASEKVEAETGFTVELVFDEKDDFYAGVELITKKHVRVKE